MGGKQNFGKRRNNKAQNLKKKKMRRAKAIEEEGRKERELKKVCDPDEEDLCKSLRKVSVPIISTTQAVFKAKLREEDQKRVNKDLKSICKDLENMLSHNQEDEKDQECFAEVENLSKNVEELLIGTENYEPGFRFSKWQQKQFLKQIKNKNKDK